MASKTVQFSKYESLHVERNKRIKYWFMRRRLYQWFVWKRYGKKVMLTRFIKLEPK